MNALIAVWVVAGVIYYFFVLLVVPLVLVCTLTRLFLGKELYRYLDDQHKHEYYIGKKIAKGIADSEELEIYQNAVKVRLGWASKNRWLDFWLAAITFTVTLLLAALPPLYWMYRLL